MNPDTQRRGELAIPALEMGEPAVMPRAARAVPAHRSSRDAAGSSPAITPKAVLRALRRRSSLALGVAVLATGIAGPLAWYLVPTAPFRAEARLHVASAPPRVLLPTVETQTNTTADYFRYQNTQKTLVKSRLVLSAALRDPKAARSREVRDQVDAIAWLQEKLRVDFVGGSEVMEISLAGRDARDVAAIVNAVKQAYMDEVVNVDAKRRVDRYDYLKKIKEHYADLLKQKRETMRKLAEAVGSDDRQTLALRQQYAMEHVQYLDKELLEIQSQRRKAEVRLKAHRPEGAEAPATAPSPPSREEVERLIDEHPAVEALAGELAERQRQLDEERAKLRRVTRNVAAEPSVRSLANTVRGLREALARRREEVRPEVVAQAGRQAVAEEATRGDGLGQELTMLADLEQRVRGEIESIQKVNQSLTTNTLDLQSSQEDLVQMEETYKKVAQEVEALNVELEAPARIREVDDATVPVVRDEKKRFLMIGVVTLGAFLAGLFGVALLELRSLKVDSAEEIPTELGLSVVGALPILPTRNYHRGALGRREADRDRYWRNLLLESVDATRTLLVHAARTGSYRVMLVTSASPGEGKTSLASYLATSMARSGMRTLLIDADLRSPMMHKLFDRPPGPGLSELLRGEADPDDALAQTAVPDLTLLPAGRCDREALRTLARGGAAPIFDRLKEQFDFVIVDSSPILPVADGMLIAQHVDAALFSIFRDVSRKAKVRSAFERLQRLGVPVLGAVVTGEHGGYYGNEYYDADLAYGTLPESVAGTSNGS